MARRGRLPTAPGAAWSTALGEAGEVDFLCVGVGRLRRERHRRRRTCGRCGSMPMRTSEPSTRARRSVRSGLPRRPARRSTRRGVEDDGPRRGSPARRLRRSSTSATSTPGACTATWSMPGDRRLRRPRRTSSSGPPAASGPPGPALVGAGPMGRAPAGRPHRRAAARTRVAAECAAAVDAITLCSAARRRTVRCDQRRRRSRTATSAPSSRRVRRERTPTVLFVGALGYPPNADAARWFVERGAPVDPGRPTRRAVPHRRRAASTAVADLASVDGVERARPRGDSGSSWPAPTSRSCRSAPARARGSRWSRRWPTGCPWSPTTVRRARASTSSTAATPCSPTTPPAFARGLRPPARPSRSCGAELADGGEPTRRARATSGRTIRRRPRRGCAGAVVAQAPQPTGSRTTAGEWRKNCSTSRS